MEGKSNLQSKTFQRAEKNLNDKWETTFLENYQHYTMPGYNLNSASHIDEWDLDSVKELYRKFPYKCDLPKPLLPPAKLPRTVLHQEDPALEILTVKSYLTSDINRYIDNCQKFKKDFETINRNNVQCSKSNNKENIKVPRYIAELAEIIESDPDPYLKGNYNWYYTGGCLSLYDDISNILLFPYMGELVASPLTAKSNNLWKPVLKDSTKYNLNGTLYELKNNRSRILGRYKHHCIIYMLSEFQDQIKFINLHKVSSKIPYVSADLQPDSTKRYCTVNVEREIILWDIIKRKQISHHKITSSGTLSDAWGNISYQLNDSNLLIFTDRCCLNYLDTRIPFDQPILKLCPKSYLQQCENISLEAGSRNSSCRYIGTSHSLLLCDSRFPKRCVQQKWTHQFKSAPLLNCVINRDDQEIIVLSSQLAGESSIILNKWTDEENPHSFNLPYTPPTIMDTLNESRLKGMCLNPSLKSRLQLCNTGSALIENNNDVFFFFQNSIGDIFYQCIIQKREEIDSEICRKSISALSSWEQALLAQNGMIIPSTISGKSDMTHIYENLTNKKLRLYAQEELKNDYDPSWKQSIQQLNSYIDILAPELLSVWEISEEEPVPLSTAPHQKVLSWLESAENILSQEEVQHTYSPENTQESVNLSQEIDITYLNDTNALQEMFLPKVKRNRSRNKTATKK